MKVAVQIPAFRERETIRTALDGWTSQMVPHDHALSVQAWVTPETPAFEDDPTVSVAREYPSVSVHHAPQGYLSTRNAAHSHALAQGYDAIIKTDADVTPANDTVLAAVVDALDEPGVEAVNSHVRTVGGVAGPIATAAAAVEGVVRPHMNGQLSAFTTHAWDAIGPFDDSVDQTDVRELRAEVERGFYRRLQGVGDVVKPRQVKVYEGARRVECHVQRPFARFGHPQSSWCEERGIQTFHWRR